MNQQSEHLGKRASDMLRAIPTAEQFAIQFNLDSCSERYMEYKEIQTALKSLKIKLRELSQVYGERAIVAWIQTWLISLSMYMNFEITEQQAISTATTILEECYMLNIVEFNLLFRKMKKGNYGIFYGKFNGQTIIKACIQFRKERGLILSKMSEEEQKKIMS